MLFQVLCGFEPVFYTTHPNEEPYFLAFIDSMQPYINRHNDEEPAHKNLLILHISAIIKAV